MLSAVILTFNSQAVIEDTIRAAQKISDDVHVVDSHSTDDTVAIVRKMSATVTQRPFKDYSDQRNWAIDNLPLRYGWQMHLDADEILSKLRNPMIDDHRMSLSEWTARHNRWSDLEIEDLGTNSGAGVTPRASGTAIEQARYRKSMYYRLPLFVRPLMLFCYRYFVRLGFLDGVPGLIYCVLQVGWYRFLVDAKLYERAQRR